MVVYRGWFGQLGKIALLVMIISEPQQTLLYTPNPSLISPFCGTVSDTPKSRACVHLCTLAHIGLTLTTRHFEWLIGGIGLPLGPNVIHWPKMSIVVCRKETVIEGETLSRLP